jgi:hypothetical protein
MSTMRMHSALVGIAQLAVLSFAATVAAASPVAGVLRLVRSFIHRRPVSASVKICGVRPTGFA